MLGARTRWIQMLVMVLGSLFAAFTMNACESTPKWVKTGTYSGQDSKAFYGVGGNDGYPQRTARVGCS